MLTEHLAKIFIFMKQVLNKSFQCGYLAALFVHLR